MRHEGGTGRRADRLCPPRAGRGGTASGGDGRGGTGVGRPAGAECGAAALRQALRRQEARRARALDAFLDGTLSREELAALTARSEAERSRLARRLADLEMAGAERPERRAALLDWLAGELAGGEAVLDAAVKRVTVQADALLVELEELPLCFRVRAQAGGRGRRGGLR